MLIGIALLAGGLVALCFPVYLDAYDQWGMQVNCGNGYHGELLQATVDDSGGVDPQSAATGAPGIVRPALHYVDSCKSALVRRHAWAVPVAGAGAVILILELLAWARGGSTTDEGVVGQPQRYGCAVGRNAPSLVDCRKAGDLTGVWKWLSP